ncbi:MAG: 2TM domain-containing protein [Planctomycetes bacterium]|nr:2TM domain-containing protein [Planctomycetota bacterium]
MKDSWTDGDIEQRARRRVDRKLGFYVHALVYVLVNLGLFGINHFTGGPRWHLMPLMGWGIGLAVHGIVVLATGSGVGLRERMVAAELERMKREY